MARQQRRLAAAPGVAVRSAPEPCKRVRGGHVLDQLPAGLGPQPAVFGGVVETLVARYPEHSALVQFLRQRDL